MNPYEILATHPLGRFIPRHLFSLCVCRSPLRRASPLSPVCRLPLLSSLLSPDVPLCSRRPCGLSARHGVARHSHCSGLEVRAQTQQSRAEAARAASADHSSERSRRMSHTPSSSSRVLCLLLCCCAVPSLLSFVRSLVRVQSGGCSGQARCVVWTCAQPAFCDVF